MADCTKNSNTKDNNSVTNSSNSENNSIYELEEIERLRKLIEERPPIEEIYKKEFGIDVDYSNDGYFLDKLDNYLVPESDEALQSDFIVRMATLASSKKLLFILIDDGFAFSRFIGFPSLLFPIISDKEKVITVFKWLLSEMNSRLTTFTESGCKDISSYDALKVSEKPHIVVIVNEAYYLLNKSGIDDILVPLLINSKRTGIHFYLFSRFSEKNLSLGIKSDLLRTCDSVDLEQTFSKSYEDMHNLTIEEIDNNIDGINFEDLCGKLLEKNGFTNISVTKSSGDFGADIIAYKEEVKYAIQCKKYSTPVGVCAVQEVIASKSIYDCHVACVLTNNYFTPAAVELAKKNLVLLWDRNKLKKIINDAHEDKNTI